MTNEKLRTASITALAEYMGIAAEFVVDDALDEVSKNPAFGGNTNLQEMYFFVCLGKMIPPTVPFATLKQAIIKATGIKA